MKVVVYIKGSTNIREYTSEDEFIVHNNGEGYLIINKTVKGQSNTRTIAVYSPDSWLFYEAEVE